MATIIPGIHEASLWIDYSEPILSKGKISMRNIILPYTIRIVAVINTAPYIKMIKGSESVEAVRFCLFTVFKRMDLERSALRKVGGTSHANQTKDEGFLDSTRDPHM